MDQDPDSLGAVVQQRAQTALRDSKSEKTNNSALSKNGRGSNLAKCDPVDFAKAMAYLTAMKRTADLSKVQLTTWHGALAGFPIEIVNESVLEIALKETRFPELGDLYQACRARAIKAGIIRLPYVANGNPEKQEITGIEIKAIAKRLGLKVT